MTFDDFVIAGLAKEITTRHVCVALLSCGHCGPCMYLNIGPCRLQARSALHAMCLDSRWRLKLNVFPRLCLRLLRAWQPQNGRGATGSWRVRLGFLRRRRVFVRLCSAGLPQGDQRKIRYAVDKALSFDPFERDTALEEEVRKVAECAVFARLTVVACLFCTGLCLAVEALTGGSHPAAGGRCGRTSRSRPGHARFWAGG